ncbi:hypothetical protein [Vibrio furnissii]|uniref:hypothetical protein n=1 Tax=Vibrio furnissii TaxID=29494 RepID=UPI00375273C7
MDKELLARKLYVERVSELMGDQPINQALLDTLWDNKASPAEAARVMSEMGTGYDAPSWMARYLNRR